MISPGEMRKVIEASVEFEPNTGCWLWERGVTGDGYGSLKFAGYPRGAHRASWVAHRGPIPAGLHILHRCDTPQCVNPDHLRPGTHRENMGDMSAKGRRRQPPTGTYAKMDACRRGHPFDAQNTFIDSRGDRGCLTCRRARLRAFKQRKRVNK
jgi:hypothetical protein